MVMTLAEVAAAAILTKKKLENFRGDKTVHELAQDPAWAIASKAAKELAEVFGWECR